MAGQRENDGVNARPSHRTVSLWSDINACLENIRMAEFYLGYLPEKPNARDQHVEAVAFADDIAEGGDPVPEDYERHYCEEDGQDWPCAVVRAGYVDHEAIQVQLQDARQLLGSIALALTMGGDS